MTSERKVIVQTIGVKISENKLCLALLVNLNLNQTYPSFSELRLSYQHTQRLNLCCVTQKYKHTLDDT